jgi:hypothetical protein
MSFTTVSCSRRNPDPDDGKRLSKERDTFLLLSGPNQYISSFHKCCVAFRLTFPHSSSNLFGERDPKTYGSTTLDQIEERVTEVGKELGVKV